MSAFALLRADDELAKHLRLLAIVCLCALAASAAIGWFSQPDGSPGAFLTTIALFMLGPVLVLVAMAIGLVMIVAGARIGKTEEGRRRMLAFFAAPAAFGIIVASVAYLPSAGAIVRRHHILSENLAIFARAVNETELAGEAITLASGGEIRPRAEEGPSRRVYFPFLAAADNSQGFLYDPTSEVRHARGWKGEPGRFTAPPAVREILGGDLLACAHVRGPYYYCTFT